MATQLQTTNFCDTGFLNNATEEEKPTIIALSMYQRLGSSDPSNTYAEMYRNKDIIHLYRKTPEEKQTKTNTLLKIYSIIHLLEEEVEQHNKNKTKTINKSKGKSK